MKGGTGDGIPAGVAEVLDAGDIPRGAVEDGEERLADVEADHVLSCGEAGDEEGEVDESGDFEEDTELEEARPEEGGCGVTLGDIEEEKRSEVPDGDGKAGEEKDLTGGGSGAPSEDEGGEESVEKAPREWDKRGEAHDG